MVGLPGTRVRAETSARVRCRSGKPLRHNIRDEECRVRAAETLFCRLHF